MPPRRYTMKLGKMAPPRRAQTPQSVGREKDINRVGSASERVRRITWERRGGPKLIRAPGRRDVTKEIRGVWLDHVTYWGKIFLQS